MIILYALILSIVINLIVFVIAYILQTDKLTDLTYAGTFVVLAACGLSLAGWTWPGIVLFVMVLLWALRLGTYLGIRIHKKGRDKRFDDMRPKFWRFAGFWSIQATTIWVLSIPVLLFLSQAPETIGLVSFAGLAIWLIGLIIETTADLQKYRFINDRKNKGKWIERGLWRYSRHPNYFGEMLVWIGVYVFVAPALPLWQGFVALIGPLFIIFLLLRVSGVPMLEKAADKRWGSQKAYQEYKKRTRVIIPLPR